MFSHATLGTNNWEVAKPFWHATMASLGNPVFIESEEGAAFGSLTGPKIFVGPAYDGEQASNGNGTHLAFIATDRATVDRFYQAALANGGTDEGPPGLRPHYHPNYYGA